ncbi:hypothetical protein C9374_008419 [Naegleria lovaniensis]|uniref:Uncharacterized protein n=1 Tax=Naegleria lovaniensis TaxID=51637 RepID=A0AA88GKS1_NAELO|nr:uncharacterized protein C9374_008419 [Naegleria lovaniensis]KAG2378276.1 hypothetical protein C9374_008419 [Naegleria lovaniensis]
MSSSQRQSNDAVVLQQLEETAKYISNKYQLDCAYHQESPLRPISPSSFHALPHASLGRRSSTPSMMLQHQNNEEYDVDDGASVSSAYTLASGDILPFHRH